MKSIKKLPDTLLIVCFILILFTVLTWIVPAGRFERQKQFNEATNSERELVVQGSYQQVERSPQGIAELFTAPLRGFQKKADIIAFIFLVGGAFSVVSRTGAIRAGLYSIVRFSLKRPRNKVFILPLIMVLFSLCGATFGMSEEVLVFILVTIPLALSLGYDTIVGVAIPFVGAGMGFAGAFMNPFTVQIAQGIAGIPILSGIEYRLLCCAVFTFIGIAFVMRYAGQVARNPRKSVVYGIQTRIIQPSPERKGSKLSMGHTVILLGFSITIGLLIIGASLWSWYIPEIAGLFIALGIFSAVVHGLKSSVAVKAFYEGAQEMIPAAMIIGLSQGILEIATDGQIIDTILYAVSSAARDFPPLVSAEMMFWVQSGINVLIPSGSGQAALTMPIMTPLGDTLGVSRQVTVLAYQFGDGLSNLVIPTSPVTMGILAIAKIPYEKWAKWILPLMLLLFLVAMLLLIPPVLLFAY